jgi:hypothetical protein
MPQHVLSHQKRHYGKHRKHQIVDRSRKRVSLRKVLTNGLPPKPEHEPELRDQQEEERDEPHPKSSRGSEMGGSQEAAPASEKA